MSSNENLRINKHMQMLVDVGVVLHRAYGDEYAKNFLEQMAVPELVIARVLARSGLRPLMHLSQPERDH